jgi:hypothetical protein
METWSDVCNGSKQLPWQLHSIHGLLAWSCWFSSALYP